MQFFDGSNSIFPADPVEGYAIQPVNFNGVQIPFKIIEVVLDTFASTSGIVNSSDSVVGAIQKLASSVDTNYTGLHITSGTSSPLNLTALQRAVIFDSGVSGKTIKLPSATDPDVIPWVPYPLLALSGLLTSNTIGVQTGQSLNGTVNGTFTLAGITGVAKAIAITDGTAWFVS